MKISLIRKYISKNINLISILDVSERPVLSDWLTPAMGASPRANQPWKPLETVEMGST